MEIGNEAGDGEKEDVPVSSSNLGSDKMEEDGLPAPKKQSRNLHERRLSREESVDMVSDSGSPGRSKGEAVPDQLSAGSSTSSATAASSKNSVQSTSTPGEQDALPSMEEQIARITELSQVPLVENMKGYVISNQWLLEAQERGQNASKSEPGKDVQPPLDNRSLLLTRDNSMANLKDEKGERFYPLKPGLTVGSDRELEILPEEAYRQIVAWHGSASGSPEIVRYCHNTSSEAGLENMQFELYPPIFTIMKLPDSATSMQSLREKELPPAKVVASRTMPFQSFLKMAKEAASIDASKKVRVWRIVATIKETGSQQRAPASGIMTPDHSRSNSPAPTANEVDLGNKLVLDANTFLNVQLDSQRELIERKDETNNPNYNGRSNLDFVGLGQEGVLVLEEQIGGPAGGEFVSDSKAGSQGMADGPSSLATNLKTKSATASGRSSPAPAGVMTRGRAQRNGRTRGTVGLNNLGNTCYMNSALQCVKSVKELTEYFLADKYKKELNPSNPLAHNGDVAKAYATLLKELFGAHASSSFSPRHFKQVIGKYGVSFSGYGQQDSQEFLLFLLDGLQEDLNRIHKKPYIEKPDSTDEMVDDQQALVKFADECWRIYKARNDSVITDLFAGMYKSTVKCPICHKVSIIFDPFNNLTLQLPIENVWSRVLTFHPLNLPPVDVEVEIDKNASFSQLKEFLGKKFDVNPKKLVLSEVYKSRFFKHFDDRTALAEERIADGDLVTLYEVDQVPSNYPPPAKKQKARSFYSSVLDDDDDIPEGDSPLADCILVPIFHRHLKESNSRFDHREQRVAFADPTYITLNREEVKSQDLILKKVLANVASMTTKDIFGEPSSADEEADSILMSNEDTDSSDSKIQANSVQGDEEIVDISMKDADGDALSTLPRISYPPAPEIKKPLPAALEPDAVLSPGLQQLFEMKYFKSKEMIPTGWNCLNEENGKLPTIASRIPRRPKKKPSANPGEQLARRIANGGSNTSSDAEDEERPKSMPDAPAEPQSEAIQENDEDDELPPVEQLLAPPPKSANANGKPKPQSLDVEGDTGSEMEDVPETPALIRLGEGIVLDWTPEAFDSLFGGDENDEFRGLPMWNKENPRIPDPDLDQRRQVRLSRKKNGVTLDECLDEFGREEILSENDAWYCPRCKEHRRASKKFELWKAPDILVIHLKRFSAHGRFRDKLDIRVDFPVEGLDLSDRVVVKEDERELIYDLFAVDNHYGGLGGGHYTAFAQNFNDGEWIEYNDSMTSRRQNPQAVVTPAAYLLFYRRRSSGHLGGPFFDKFYGDGEELSSSQSQSRNESPARSAGEGLRLGDSSRNGSSSAYPEAEAVRQAGDGGPGIVRMIGPRTRTDGDGDALPGYSERDPQADEPMETTEMDFSDGLVPGAGVMGPPTWSFSGARRDSMGSLSSTRAASGGGDDGDRSIRSSPEVGPFPNPGTPEESMEAMDEDMPLLDAADAPQIKIRNTAGGMNDDDDQPVAEVRIEDADSDGATG